MEIAGKPVVNAKKKITIEVTQDDFMVAKKTGGVKDPAGCAAAVAAIRQGLCTQAKVHLGRTYLFDPETGKWQRFNTPADLRNEIIAFDRGGRFQPGTYELKPLHKNAIARMGMRQGSKKGDDTKSRNKRRKTGPKRSNHHIPNIRAHGGNR